MQLNDNEFDLDVISKTEFTGNYGFKGEKHLVTIWNVQVSREALSRYFNSKQLTPDIAWTDEWIQENNRRAAESTIWEHDFKRLLGQENVEIAHVHEEFFTAIRIEKCKTNERG